MVSPLSCQRTHNIVEQQRGDEDKTENDGRGQVKTEGDRTNDTMRGNIYSKTVEMKTGKDKTGVRTGLKTTNMIEQ